MLFSPGQYGGSSLASKTEQLSQSLCNALLELFKGVCPGKYRRSRRLRQARLARSIFPEEEKRP